MTSEVKLALALDLSDLDAALTLARTVAPYFSVAKVGLELLSATGPAAVSAFLDEGYAVFVDLKLHDIPTTVERTATALGRLGASYVTLHTAGGEAMLRAGVSGLTEGARSSHRAPPMALGVTVLTSDALAAPEVLAERVGLAATSGCGGIVCGAPDLVTVRAIAPELFCCVPGTRLAGEAVHDQARVATPAQAVANGASMLVIGRAVTHAADPVLAARALQGALAQGH